MENVVELNDSNFDNEVMSSQVPVLVDFWADWCGPCKALAPIISEIADEYVGKAKVAKVDVTTNQLLAGKFAEGDTIKIDADAHKFSFKKIK